MVSVQAGWAAGERGRPPSEDYCDGGGWGGGLFVADQVTVPTSKSW